MTKGRDPGRVVRAGEATCPWDLNRMTQLISRAGSLGFRPTPGGERGCSFTLPWAFLLMAAWSNRKLAGHAQLLLTRKLVGLWPYLESQLKMGR